MSLKLSDDDARALPNTEQSSTQAVVSFEHHLPAHRKHVSPPTQRFVLHS